MPTKKIVKMVKIKLTKRITAKTLGEARKKIALLPTKPIGDTCQLVRRGRVPVCVGLCQAPDEPHLKICVLRVSFPKSGSMIIQCTCEGIR